MKPVQQFIEQKLDTLKKIEQERRDLLNYGLKLTCIAIGCIVFGLLIGEIFHAFFLKVFIPLGGIGVALYCWQRKYGEYKINFKEKIIGEIVKFIDPSLNYSPSNYIEEEIFLESDIFNITPDRYYGSDYVEGKIGFTEIKFSYINAQYKTESTHTDSDGHTHTDEHWHIIFNGIFLIADFNKHFKSQVLIFPASSIKLFNVLKKKFMFFSKWETINLENPEFDKYFIVYGTDQVDARYILSTSLMQRLIDYRKKIGQDFYVSFKNSMMYMAIPGDYSFNPVLFEKIRSYKIQQYYNTLSMIVSVVDELNLNTRIWSKLPINKNT